MPGAATCLTVTTYHCLADNAEHLMWPSHAECVIWVLDLLWHANLDPRTVSESTETACHAAPDGTPAIPHASRVKIRLQHPGASPYWVPAFMEVHWLHWPRNLGAIVRPACSRSPSSHCCHSCLSSDTGHRHTRLVRAGGWWVDRIPAWITRATVEPNRMGATYDGVYWDPEPYQWCVCPVGQCAGGWAGSQNLAH